VTESVALPPDSGMSVMSQLRQIICSKCQSEMCLGRIQEGSLGYDLRTFECHRCWHQLKTAVKLADPMQSKAIMAWLQGQLVGPK
jgi:hypothetical protein